MEELIELINASDTIIKFCSNCRTTPGKLIIVDSLIFNSDRNDFFITFEINVYGANISVDYMGKNKFELQLILDCLYHNYETKKPYILINAEK